MKKTILLASLVSGLLACSSPSTEVSKASSDSKASNTSAPNSSASSSASGSAAPADTMVALTSATATASAAASGAPTSQPASPQLAEIPPAKNGVLADGVADGIVAKNGQPKVIVIDAGSEPREPLRYKLTEHKKQSVGMVMDLEMKIGVEGKVVPVKTPPMAVNMDLETGAKDAASGDVLVTATITGTKLIGDVDPQLAEKMNEAMGSMKGMKLSNYVSDEGRVRDMQVTLPPGANQTGAQLVDQMKQSFTSIAPPLPHDPVGVGAKWRSITRATAGADTLMYTTFTLKSRNGDKVELETQIQQLAASADTTAPNGVALHVTKFSSQGTGKSSVDLSELAPEKGDGNVVLGMEAAAAGQNLTVDTKVKVTFGPPVK